MAVVQVSVTQQFCWHLSEPVIESIRRLVRLAEEDGAFLEDVLVQLDHPHRDCENCHGQLAEDICAVRISNDEDIGEGEWAVTFSWGVSAL